MAKVQVEALRAAREYIVECRPGLLLSRWKTVQRYFDLLAQIDNAIRAEEVMEALKPPEDGARKLRHTLGSPDNCPACKAAAGVPVAHPTDGERDLAALCARLVRRLREVSPDDKLAATATDYLNQRRYLNPLRIKAMGPAPTLGVSVAHNQTVSPSDADGGDK